MRRADFLSSLLGLSFALAAGGASAATQGTLGATSTGSVALTYQVGAANPQIQISGLADLTIPDDPTSHSGSVTNPNVCFSGNTLAFRMTISSANSGIGPLVLKSGANARGYSVAFPDISPGTVVTGGGVTLIGLPMPNNTPGICAHRTPMTVATVDVAPGSPAPASGLYTDTLTLVLAAE